MKAISIGLADITIDGAALGSNVGGSIDMQIDTLPIHNAKVGSGYIVGNKFAIKGISGGLNIGTEEVGSVQSILSKMATVLKGEAPTKGNFSCNFASCGASLSGQVLLLPQFSASVTAEGWNSFTVQPMICGELSGSGGSITTAAVAGVPFVDLKTNKGGITKSTDNLCCAVECDGIGVGSLALSCTCQFTPIFRKASVWPIDYVVDSAKIVADIGFYDFGSVDAIFAPEASVSIKFITVGGSGLTINLGDKCVKALSGMRTSTGGIATWHIKVEGNAV